MSSYTAAVQGLPLTEEDEDAITESDEGELLCVVGIVRHGDRTPKQKLKFSTNEPSLLSLLSEFAEQVAMHSNICQTS